jgi:general secretion pathway protein H
MPAAQEPAKRARKARGFTLLELLVVIAILGIAAGIVSLSAAPSVDRLVAEEAQRLATLFRLAQDEARTRGRPIAWEADVNGYRFTVGAAPPGPENDALRPRAWPFPVQRVEAPPLVFGAEPLLPPAEIRIATDGRELVLALDAFGTVTVRQ